MKPVRLLLLAALAFSLTAAKPDARFLVLSDLHFNPLASPALAPQLLAAPATDWEKIFASDPHPAIQQYKEDSVYPLIASLISSLQQLTPKPGLIIVTGDILPHKFSEKFAASANSTDPQDFSRFVSKTVAFLGLQLQKAAGGIPIIYTVGNNDDECGDYALQPGGPFLKDSAETVERLARLTPEQSASWLTLASYASPNPMVPHHRVISLNTSFWSRRYANSCGTPGQPADPGAAVLDWLSNELQDAEKHHDKVWLAYHIPPGIDGHSSARMGQPTPLWKPAYSERFNQLLNQYRQTIELNFAGHTHLDDFRLIETPNARTLVLINPGVSPNIGQNPAYRLITLDSHGRPKDMLTYFLPDLNGATWKLEYDARRALKLKDISFESYQAFYQASGQSAEAMEKWRRYYAVSRPESLDGAKPYLRSLYCATGHASPDSFAACLQQQ